MCEEKVYDEKLYDEKVYDGRFYDECVCANDKCLCDGCVCCEYVRNERVWSRGVCQASAGNLDQMMVYDEKVREEGELRVCV